MQTCPRPRRFDRTAGSVMRMADEGVMVRPVVIWADRAVVARPPELLLPLLEAGPR